MTKLSITAPSRGMAYDPGPFLGALPLPSTDASAERWRMAARTLINPSPSAYPKHAPKPSREVPLTERLFDALSAFKLKTAILAAAHFNRDERARLFKQLDSLLDAESWDSADVVTTEASFTTLLRMVLFLGGRRPGLGVTGTGNFIATWTEGDDRLTIECKPADHVRWVLVQNLDGQRESAAGETTTRRLPEVLRPYDPPKRWFPHAPTKLPPEHHMVRNVAWAKLRKDENDPEKVIGVLGEAFKTRPVDEDVLSTTWLEYFPGVRREKIYGAIRAMRASNLDIKTKSGFAIGNVGNVAALAAAHNYSIRVLHEPDDDNKAHVAVRRWPRDDMTFFELLAADAWSELVLNNDENIPKGAQAAPDRSAWTLPSELEGS